MGETEIGLKPEGPERDGILGMGCIAAIFHCPGTYEAASDILNRSAIGAASTGAASLRNHAGMPSRPEAVWRKWSRMWNTWNSEICESPSKDVDLTKGGVYAASVDISASEATALRRYTNLIIIIIIIIRA